MIPAGKNAVFSGSDVRGAILFASPVRIYDVDGDVAESDALRYDVYFQTITASSMRTTAAVRTLGRSAAKEYTRGPRTIAGSMVLTMIDENQIAKFASIDENHEIRSYEEYFIDQLPSFDVLIYGETEGQETPVRTAERGFSVDVDRRRAAVVLGCHFVNTGDTFSVHDLMLENTFTYEALGYIPFTRNPLDRIRAYRNSLGAIGTRRAMSSLITRSTYDGGLR